MNEGRVQKYWEREPGTFNECEQRFFEERDVAPPERIVLLLAIRRSDAESMEIEFDTSPLRRPGCYFIFDTYEYHHPFEVIPLYVGRAVNLAKRLGQHWGEDENFIDEYQNCILTDDERIKRKGDFENVHLSYELFPVGCIRFAYWPEPDEKERMFLEHELIYKCRPRYNRA